MAATGSLSRAVPWAAATVFKTYSLFNESAARYLPPERIAQLYPWLTSVRILSALGGNWGPSLARDYETQMSQNPHSDSRWEREWASRYEFFRDGADGAPRPVAEQFDWREFDVLNATAAATGLELHLNMAGAPERFTGRTGHYASYHFNELPVVDEQAWKEYVATLFTHLAAQPWFGRTGFSFFSEPNCRWISHDGSVKHMGYQGNAEQYARQYLWTWQAMRAPLGPAPLYLGPWVVEPDPGEPIVNNLPVYLRAITRAFAAAGEPLPPWSAFSFNLYETPQLALDNFASYKIAAVRRMLAEELPGRTLPLRIDELGVHPIVSGAFQQATGVQLATTRWEATWHADMLALLVDQHIERAASWYPVNMLYPPDQRLTAFAAYFFLSRVGRVVDYTIGSGGTLDISATPSAGGAAGEVGVRVASHTQDRVGWMSSVDASAQSIRIAAWHHPRHMATDEQLATAALAQQLEIRLPPQGDGARRVRVLGYEDQKPFASDAAGSLRTVAITSFPGLPKLAIHELEARDRVTLTLAPGDLYLVEAE
jgi:hypothetical protein